MSRADPNRRPGRPPGTEAAVGRQSLILAARQLLAEQGLSRVTLRAVAERAGVRPTLVHYYFSGKDELLRGVVAEVADGLRERVSGLRLDADDARTNLRAYIAALVAALGEDPYAPRLLTEQILSREDERNETFIQEYLLPNATQLIDVLRAGQANGQLRNLELRFVVPSLVGMLTYFFLATPLVRQMFGDDPKDPETQRRFSEFAADLLLNGLAAEKAE